MKIKKPLKNLVGTYKYVDNHKSGVTQRFNFDGAKYFQMKEIGTNFSIRPCFGAIP